MGRVFAGVIVVVGAIAGIALYWLLVYGYYAPVAQNDLQGVRLTSVVSGTPEEIQWDALEAIAGDNNPIRYRACFTTQMSQAMLTETYQVFDAPEPLMAPAWFECFDAKAIGAALETGDAIAFLGEENPIYGVDRVIAIDANGQGYAWHQINACGEAIFHGDPVPETCPPAPIEGSE